jgi:hypothetical protein
VAVSWDLLVLKWRDGKYCTHGDTAIDGHGVEPLLGGSEVTLGHGKVSKTA